MIALLATLLLAPIYDVQRVPAGEDSAPVALAGSKVLGNSAQGPWIWDGGASVRYLFPDDSRQLIAMGFNIVFIATGTFNFAVGVPVTRKFAAMAELHSESRFDAAQDRLVAMNVGLMRSVGSSIVLYANVGHSLFSDEGVEHTYAGGGVKLLIKPDAKKSR